MKIQEGESIESALRRFKQVQQEDIIKDIKKHSLLKPGDKRRAKQRWPGSATVKSSDAKSSKFERSDDDRPTR